jgi:molybdate transport system substrate-binding protein
MLKRQFILTLALFNYLFPNSTVKVALSANVSYVIKPLIKEFNKEFPKIKIVPIIGSSGKLTTQIIHKAPYDIFMSADMEYPNRLYKMSLSSPPKVYAKGSLIILSLKNSLSNDLKVLKSSSIKRIAIANPKTAPYGRATIQAFEKAGIYKDVKSKLVFSESISQTLSYILRVTKIGIIAKSLLFSPNLNSIKNKKWLEIEKSLYDEIRQGAVILKNSNKDAVKFFDFLFMEKAKDIFINFGYNVN